MKKLHENPSLIRLIKSALILAFFFSIFLLPFDYVTNARNDAARIGCVESVCDKGTFDLSKSSFPVYDKAFLNGVPYCDKPPLIHFLSMGWYQILKHVFGISFSSDRSTTVWLLNVLWFLVSCATGFVFYAALRQKQKIPESYLLFASAMSVLSTLVLSYSVTIGNHAVSACLAMWFVWQFNLCEQKGYTEKRSFLGGVISGLLFNCEFLIGGTFGLAGGILCLRKGWRSFLSYGIGGVLLIAIEGLLNWISYRSVLPLYLLSHQPDLAGKDYLFYAFHTLFGFEGFYLYMPALLFLFYALIRGFREKKDPVRTAVLWAVFGAMILFQLSTSDFGGWCYGFRFYVPFAPVMLYYIFLYFRGWRKDFVFILFLLALGWGCLTAWMGTKNPWNASFEGHLTKPDMVCWNVRNSFLANTLAWCVEYHRDSPLTEFLIQRVYGPKLTWKYLAAEYWNRQNGPMCKYALEQYEKTETKP